MKNEHTYLLPEDNLTFFPVTSFPRTYVPSTASEILNLNRSKSTLLSININIVMIWQYSDKVPRLPSGTFSFLNTVWSCRWSWCEPISLWTVFQTAQAELLSSVHNSCSACAAWKTVHREIGLHKLQNFSMCKWGFQHFLNQRHY